MENFNPRRGQVTLLAFYINQIEVFVPWVVLGAYNANPT